ncbi:MAG TPA: hypothetical protein VFP34_00580 [Microlunatus sp.]|nr:hypothetical protein [Microlunatus sp.]
MSDPSRPTAIELALVPRPAELRMHERRRFLLDLVVTNRGDEPIDPSLDGARLSINGEDSVYFALALSNGIRDRSRRLLPSQTATNTWPNMGRSLFPRPGDYTLELSLGEVTAPAVLVRVRRW